MNYETNDILFAKDFPSCNKCIGSNKENRQYPIQAWHWENVIKRVIPYESGKDENYLIVKNIIYNLQFIEFINKCFKDLYFNLKDKMRLENVSDYRYSNMIEATKTYKIYKNNDIYDLLLTRTIK